MTAHPIDTEALRKQYAPLVEKYGPEAWAESRAHVVLSLLDALAAAEHRATRAEAQSAIRGRAVAIYQQRAREAEAERDVWRASREEALDAMESAEDTASHYIGRTKAAEARVKAVEAMRDTLHLNYTTMSGPAVAAALTRALTA